jgi:NH3-dependent NAD+ synthetase
MTRKPKTDRNPSPASILRRPQTPELEVQREQNKLRDDLKIALDRLNDLYTQKRLADRNQSQAAHQKQIERLLLLQESFVASF